MASALQLSLNNPADYQPLPHGTVHYVAALQTKPGELRALQEASLQTWARLTPLIEVLGPKVPGSEPFSRDRVERWVKRLADAVGTHPIFLDRLRLAPNHVAETRQRPMPVLAALHAEARRRGIEFVPVVHLDDVAATLRHVADAAAEDGRGAGIRVRLLGTSSADGRSLPMLISQLLMALNLDIGAADLLMDLRQIPEDVEVDAADLVQMIDELNGIGAWRNVVLIATAMPRTLGGGIVEAGTIGRLPRKEWVLWNRIRQSQIKRIPTYGDYAIQHPDPPLDVTEGQLPLGLRGAIRYTHEAVTVIPRALAPRHEEGKAQYGQLCRLLVQQPEFLGGDYTWGDQQVAECAAGTREPGWEDHWRGAGTSHHLRYVVDQIARLS